ncbi:sporulation kinase B [Bacillus sp. NRRL B-14911]|uniref:ATP-binding protein n=1 Tax=Bacillus TaxID=1386 RepID=UPI00006B4466|nr:MULTISPECIES: ATP-binding protein [Bacillus]EAR66807.1 sporulation kinase B [Bacillus sp. NRRL B-14911]MCK6205403.1 two-component sensor histidine kinase [Bacillus infantis]
MKLREFAENLFLHFFIMMIIPLMHNVSIKHEKRAWVMFFAAAASLVLTLAFPVRMSNGLEFDMKFIPVFFCFFYLGPVGGYLSIAALLILMALFNIDNLYVTLINYFIISIPMLFIRKKYQKINILGKTLVAFAFYFLITFTRLIYFLQTGHIQHAVNLALFFLLSFISLCAAIYIMEMYRLHSEMAEKLQTADKSNAISQLAASVAHEIRNPMTTIRGFLQLMKEEQNLTDGQRSYVATSLEELDRANHIISDFLSLAKPSISSKEKLPVTDLVREISEFIRPFALLSQAEIRCRTQDDLYIYGNANEFKQLMINLIKNGVESMPDGGSIIVTAEQDQKEVSVKIKDEGSGLSPGQLKQLGSPYYSTKTKGTGLGLLISFDIIKRLDGHYEIISEKNKGTEFILIFPAAERQSSGQHPNQPL